MIAVAFVLGCVPSLANSLITACIGYYTVYFQSPRFFFKAMVLLYAAPVISVLLTQYDQYFNEKYAASLRLVYGLRLFGPVVGLLAGLAFVAMMATEQHVLCAIALVGLSSGLLHAVGSHVVGRVDAGNLRVIWCATAVGGVLCVVLSWAVGFGPYVSVDTYQQLFIVGCGAVVVMMSVVAFYHLSGDLDLLYSPENEALVPKEAETTEDSTAQYLQFVNMVFTVVPLPLLPWLLSPGAAQTLVFWKLFIDFFGSGILFVLPAKCSLVQLGLLQVVRLATFGLGAAAIAYDAPFWLLATVWDVFVGLGFVLNGLHDLVGSRDGLHARIRRNRVAHFAGVVFGLAVAGAVLYGVLGVEPKGTCACDCGKCSELNPTVSAGSLTCGAPGKGPGTVEVFAYGANLDCAKLEALGIQPKAAAFATAPGRCLHFAAGGPVSKEEPAFASLRACDGCVNGMVQTWSDADMQRLNASEPGYHLERLNVTMDGRPRAVLAFIMQGEPPETAPSPRYAGKVLCAREVLGAGASTQLACELAALGMRRPECDRQYANREDVAGLRGGT